MKKRFLSLFVASLVLVSATACGDKGNNTNNSTPASGTVESAVNDSSSDVSSDESSVEDSTVESVVESESESASDDSAYSIESEVPESSEELEVSVLEMITPEVVPDQVTEIATDFSLDPEGYKTCMGYLDGVMIPIGAVAQDIFNIGWLPVETDDPESIVPAVLEPRGFYIAELTKGGATISASFMNFSDTEIPISEAVVDSITCAYDPELPYVGFTTSIGVPLGAEDTTTLESLLGTDWVPVIIDAGEGSADVKYAPEGSNFETQFMVQYVGGKLVSASAYTYEVTVQE